MQHRLTTWFERRKRLLDERGFSMIPAITAVFVGSLISLGAWSAAHGDVGLQNSDRWSKVAYSQAESGVTDYVQHMAEDAGYWQWCDSPQGITGDGVGQTAINDTDRGGAGNTKVRRWLPSPDAGTPAEYALTGQYTIDLLPANGIAKCSSKSNRAESMVDKVTGTIRIRVTGRAGPQPPPTANVANWRQTKWKRRSVIIEFRRKGFLDYAYFTDKEGADPVLQGASQKDKCTKYYTPPIGSAATEGRFYYNGMRNGGWGTPTRIACTEIRFANGDFIGGPVHTNDSILLASNKGATFGTPGKNDVTEVFDGRCPFRLDDYDDHNVPPNSNDPSNVARDCPPATGSGSVAPNLNGPLVVGPNAGFLPLPESNQDLKIYGDPTNTDEDYQGLTFYGLTSIVLKNGSLDITNNGTTSTYSYPKSGVIYVANSKSVASCDYDPNTNYPMLTDGCALAEVKGTYDTPLTIASEADVVVTGNLRRSSSVDTAVLGLIGNNFVRVRHYDYAGRCGNPTNTSSNPRVNDIQAAILTLNHSFIVDRYNCGSDLGDLNMTGVLAQAYRGTVGTSGGTGYTKNYVYDYRYKYLTPPHFLTPTLSTWRIIRYREQAPACKCD